MRKIKENSIFICIGMICMIIVSMGLCVADGRAAKEIYIDKEQGDASALYDFPLVSHIEILDEGRKAENAVMDKYILYQNGAEKVKCAKKGNKQPAYDTAMKVFGLEEAECTVEPVKKETSEQNKGYTYEISAKEISDTTMLLVVKEENHKIQFAIYDENHLLLDAREEEMQFDDTEKKKILGYNIEGECINIQMLLENKTNAEEKKKADISVASIVIQLKENKIISIDRIPITLYEKEKGMSVTYMGGGSIRRNDKMIYMANYLKKLDRRGRKETMCQMIRVYDCKTREELYSCNMLFRTSLWKDSKKNAPEDHTDLVEAGYIIPAGGNNGASFTFPSEEESE